MTVFSGEVVIHNDADVQNSVNDSGDLTVANLTSAVTFARGTWTHCITELFEE